MIKVGWFRREVSLNNGDRRTDRAGFAWCLPVANYHSKTGRSEGASALGGDGGNASSAATTILLEILRFDGEAGLRERLQDQVALGDPPFHGLHAQLVEEVIRY